MPTDLEEPMAVQEASAAMHPALSIEIAAPFLQGTSHGRGPMPANAKHLTSSELNDYTRAAEREIRGYAGDAKGMTVQAMRVGRGVPVPLSSTQLVRLIRAVVNNYDMAPDAEITVVTSPVGVSDGLLEKLSACGVNRIELEMHSSDEREIDLMGGEYDQEVIQHAFEVIGRSGIHAVDVVLTVGIPGQSMTTLRDSIVFALSARPTALSLRALFLRDDTKLAVRYAQREEVLPDQFDLNEIMTMSRAPENMLAQYGYRQYYPGRFAKEGFESKGVLLDTSSVDLMGYGCGATSRFDGFTFECTDDFDQYVAHSTEPAAIYVNIRRLNKPTAEATDPDAQAVDGDAATPGEQTPPANPSTPAPSSTEKTASKKTASGQARTKTSPAKKKVSDSVPSTGSNGTKGAVAKKPATKKATAKPNPEEGAPKRATRAKKTPADAPATRPARKGRASKQVPADSKDSSTGES